MAKQRKLWRFASTNHELKKYLAEKLRISGVIAQILLNRGLGDEDEATEFLFGKLDSLHDPYLLKDMQKAVQRIQCAIENQEKITIYGDYDVDGVTSTALIFRVLKRLGAIVEYYLPDRQNEGYGLNCTALELIYKSGTSLLITVDCGINAIEEVSAIGNKIDIIISDHHQPSAILPKACAVINPKRKDCIYPDKNLAGVGVAFKLCQALWALFCKDADEIFDYLDLVAIGTIADIVPLLGENRIMVKSGLLRLKSTSNQGLRALLNSANLEDVDSGKVGFIIAPRLNAAGRIGQVTAGVELLITEDKERAAELTLYIEQQNALRQAVEKDILAAAEAMMADYDLQTNKVIVLSGVDWHSGVIGIVASRLLDKYFRPVIIINEKDGIGKGSCRSIPGFDMFYALNACSDLLIKFGGHPLAAGLSISLDKIAELRERLNNIASQILQDDDYIPTLKIDELVSLQEINTAFLEELACLSPFGMGNPRPVFVSRGVIPENAKTIGREGQHLKMTVRQQHICQNVISWEMGSMVNQLLDHSKIDVAFAPEFNEWQGRRNIQLNAKDIKQTIGNQSGNNRNMELERIVVGQVYLVLKSLKVKQEVTWTTSQISARITSCYGTELTCDGIDLALRILEELGLISVNSLNDSHRLSLLPTPAEKLNIEKSSTFREGRLAQQFMIGNKNGRA